MAARVEYTGQTFNYLTVVKYVGSGMNRNSIYLVRCVCGNEIEKELSKIKNGRIKSCGCRQIEGKLKHGFYNTPTYQTWKAIIHRTQNKKSTNWQWYGGKGIKIDYRWLKFENFLADMGPRPEGHTLDRKNPFKHYTKNNCKWSTAVEQAHNKCANWNGEYKPLETDIIF